MLGARKLSKIIQTGVYIHSDRVNVKHFESSLTSAAGNDIVFPVISTWLAGFKTQQSSRKERRYGNSIMQRRLTKSLEMVSDTAIQEHTVCRLVANMMHLLRHCRKHAPHMQSQSGPSMTPLAAQPCTRMRSKAEARALPTERASGHPGPAQAGPTSNTSSSSTIHMVCPQSSCI